MSKPLVMADPQVRHVDANGEGILIEITDGFTDTPLHFSGAKALNDFVDNLKTALRLSQAGLNYGQTKAVTPRKNGVSIH